ncbi:thioredoxin family protein [soil metagenome]
MSGAGSDALEAFAMQAVASDALDGVLAAAPGLVCVYLWGYDCFNCDIAKGQMLLNESRVKALGFDWLECNVYADTRMRDRFALHGVPAFFFFQGGRKLGRITGWPGIAAFCEAVERLQLKTGVSAPISA